MPWKVTEPNQTVNRTLIEIKRTDKTSANPIDRSHALWKTHAGRLKLSRFGALFEVGRINVRYGGVGLSMQNICAVFRSCGKG
jgi:hypothetical protein